MKWEQVISKTAGLSQEAIETFWDELVLLVDPRDEHVPEVAVRKAMRAAMQDEWYSQEDGQGVIEYLAIIGLVALVFFILATWLLGDQGVLQSLRDTLAQVFR